VRKKTHATLFHYTNHCTIYLLQKFEQLQKIINIFSATQHIPRQKTLYSLVFTSIASLLVFSSRRNTVQAGVAVIHSHPCINYMIIKEFSPTLGSNAF